MSGAKTGKRRVVEKHFVNGKPYWEIQVRVLFGWKNQFPADGGFPERIYYSKEEALKEFNGINMAEELPEETVIAMV